jgi:hypothetical protein
MRAFYDLRPDEPTSPAEAARLQADIELDRDRRAVERAHARGRAEALTRALRRLNNHRSERSAA